MQSRRYSYLISIAYFGARFKGWAKQTGQATVEGKLERVFRFVLGHDDFTLIGSSRTDSGVSCRGGFVQLFLREKVEFESCLAKLNEHLGGEIRLGSVKETSRDFNLIQSVEKKTYCYFFSDSPDFHPFASSFLTQVFDINSLERMRENASLYVGKRDFRAFCKMSENKKNYTRTILETKVYETEEFLGGFFPEKVFCFEVTGAGFLHHQVRKMVSAVWKFSPGEILERLEQPNADWAAVPTAPAAGLILWETILDLK